MVRNAVTEMRRYYSRKVVDVLIKVTRASLDAIRKRFVIEIGSGKMPFFSTSIPLKISPGEIFGLKFLPNPNVFCEH